MYNMFNTDTSTLIPILACPRCHGSLTMTEKNLHCHNSTCPAQPKQWPLVQGIPILLDESSSLFRIDGCHPPSQQAKPKHPWRKTLSKLWHTRPGISRNVAAERNYRHMRQLLTPLPATVLVVGCGEEGFGIHNLTQGGDVHLIGLDVRWTNSLSVLGDAQQLPFVDQAFDAVILQGVLEHILNPHQVEREVYRVLKTAGIVYSELPFLQPNHGGAYDFTRFTYTGHRHFWQHFEQVDAGACCGPGMALAHMIQQFARAFSPIRSWYIISDWLTDWFFWWLKYFDAWMVNHPAGLDGANAFYFLGRKRDRKLSDKAILKSYRGAQ